MKRLISLFQNKRTPRTPLLTLLWGSPAWLREGFPVSGHLLGERPSPVSLFVFELIINLQRAMSNLQCVWDKRIWTRCSSAHDSGWANSGRRYVQSVRRKSFSSWNSGKLSHVSGGCTSNAASMSTAKSDKNVSACSTIKSDHHAKAFGIWQKNNRQKGNELLTPRREMGREALAGQG